jgi:hypothetical protein
VVAAPQDAEKMYQRCADKEVIWRVAEAASVGGLF